jgi:hypothetical protein
MPMPMPINELSDSGVAGSIRFGLLLSKYKSYMSMNTAWCCCFHRPNTMVRALAGPIAAMTSPAPMLVTSRCISRSWWKSHMDKEDSSSCLHGLPPDYSHSDPPRYISGESTRSPFGSETEPPSHRTTLTQIPHGRSVSRGEIRWACLI